MSADLVIATFYNFKPANVRPAIAAAWSAADPDEIQQARMTAAGRTLAGLPVKMDDAAVAEATTFAANIDAVEALILHSTIGGFPPKLAKATRGWTEEEWVAGIVRLAGRDLVRDNGELTAHGAEYREAIEHRTNDICRRQVETIGDEATLRLVELLEPLRTGLLASGVFDAFRRSREKDPES